MRKWKSASAYIQGQGHLQKSIPCQDRTYTLMEKDVNVISLADGAGSCKFSHFGAQVVTQITCENMVKIFDDLYNMNESQIQETIIEFVLKKLKTKASELETNIIDFSSTLLFVAIKNNKYIAGHIGDGIIGYLSNESIDILSYPDNGEYANSTYFVTKSDARKYLRIYRGELTDITGFILISDGTAEGGLYDKGNKKLTLGAIKILEWLDNNLSSYVSSALNDNLEKIFKERTDDDCSINLLKLVTKDINEINNLPFTLKSEFLNSQDKKNIKNILKILNSISSGCRDARSISKEVNLPKRTVKKHVNDLLESKFLKLVDDRIVVN